MVFFSYFYHASLIVKLVMMVLFIGSISSWTIIFHQSLLLAKVGKRLAEFEANFWSMDDLVTYYQKLQSQPSSIGLERVFLSGFKEFLYWHRQLQSDTKATLVAIRRVMKVASVSDIGKLEASLPFLATVGSVSPYVGLLGTVWGIMMSLQALGSATQATIAVVAPGVSEALIATAMGLFAAIPAVIAYNRYTIAVERICSRYEVFQEQLIALLCRQLQKRPKQS